mmetsp:Transcript_39133/g.44799  ORF Transcript_39133/g.44799 Transcript_39133/m.44799 type:complete len:239 (-) Transcript_39133:22-738(-)
MLKQQVVRLKVPVCNSLLVSIIKPTKNLLYKRPRFLLTNPAVRPGLNILRYFLALGVLHDLVEGVVKAQSVILLRDVIAIELHHSLLLQNIFDSCFFIRDIPDFRHLEGVSLAVDDGHGSEDLAEVAFSYLFADVVLLKNLFEVEIVPVGVYVQEPVVLQEVQIVVDQLDAVVGEDPHLLIANVEGVEVLYDLLQDVLRERPNRVQPVLVHEDLPEQRGFVQVADARPRIVQPDLDVV